MQPSEATVNQRARAPMQSGLAGWVHWLTLLLLVAASSAIRLLYLTNKPYWFDEAFSVEVARIGWRNFLHLLWWREANMSLYYVLLRAWLHLGQNEFFIRSLSALVGAATVPAIYWLGRLLYDRKVALIAAALCTFNAYSVRYAQEARSYALFLLLATLSSGFLMAWLREPSRRHRSAYILASVLAVYAHFYALLLIAAQWLGLRWFGIPEDAESARSRRLRSAWTAIGIAVFPLMVFVAKTGAGPIRWIQRPGIHDLVEFCEHMAGSNSWPLPVILAAACIAAVVSLGGRLGRRSQDWETWRVQFLLLWLLFPVVLTLILSFARPVFLARYMIFCLPPFLVLAADGLSRLRQSWLLAVVLAGVLLLSGQGIFFVYSHDFDAERDASVAAAEYILDHREAGDGVIFHIAETRIPYEFVRSQRTGANTASPTFSAAVGPQILFPEHGPGLDYRDFTGKPGAEVLSAAAASHSRVWVMLMNNGTPGKPDATTGLITKSLGDSFPQVERWQFPKVEVRLYRKE